MLEMLRKLPLDCAVIVPPPVTMLPVEIVEVPVSATAPPDVTFERLRVPPLAVIATLPLEEIVPTFKLPALLLALTAPLPAATDRLDADIACPCNDTAPPEVAMGVPEKVCKFRAALSDTAPPLVVMPAPICRSRPA